MKSLLAAIFLTFVCSECHSQNEFSNIALSKGFIFNTDKKTVVSSGKECRYGQFAISDIDGNLQLFGDASHVYDRDGRLLYKCDTEYGIGSMSWVVANPKKQNQFYVFNYYEKTGAPSKYQEYIVISHYFVINVDDGNNTIKEKIVYTHRDSVNYESYCHTSCVLLHPDGDKLWFVIRNGIDKFTSFLIEEGEVVQETTCTIDMLDRNDNDFYLPIKTNPRQNAIFLPTGIVLDFNNRTGELKMNDKFKIPDDIVSFEFSQSGKYLYCAKNDGEFLTISRYLVSQLEQGITGNEDILYKEKLEMEGRTSLRIWMHLFRHPNSSIYLFCYNDYISKIIEPDSLTPVFIPDETILPSKLNSNIPFHHCLILSRIIPCAAPAAPRIIHE